MQTKNIYIIGNGDEAKITADLIEDNDEMKLCGNFEVFNSNIDYISTDGNLHKNIDFNHFANNQNYFCIAIGYNYDRFKVYEILKKFQKIKWISIISDTAKIRAGVIIGNGCIVHDNVYINRRTVLGNHCIINNNTSIDHDCKLSDFSSTGPAVVTGGRINLGKLSYVGMNSVVLQNINIGQSTVIGAKSLVNKDCQSNSLYFGITSKFIKKLPNDFNYFK